MRARTGCWTTSSLKRAESTITHRAWTLVPEEKRLTDTSYPGHLVDSPSRAYLHCEAARGLEERWKSGCCIEISAEEGGPLKVGEGSGDGELSAREHTLSWWGFEEKRICTS